MNINDFITKVQNAKDNGATSIFFQSSCSGEEYDFSIHDDKDDIEEADGKLAFYIEAD